jgi:tRNA G26 N,N-dimethylase Trm1
MSRVYMDRTCFVCGETVSSAGVAWYSHMSKHERAGTVAKRQHYYRNKRRRMVSYYTWELIAETTDNGEGHKLSE